MIQQGLAAAAEPGVGDVESWDQMAVPPNSTATLTPTGLLNLTPCDGSGGNGTGTRLPWRGRAEGELVARGRGRVKGMGEETKKGGGGEGRGGRGVRGTGGGKAGEVREPAGAPGKRRREGAAGGGRGRAASLGPGSERGGVGCASAEKTSRAEPAGTSAVRDSASPGVAAAARAYIDAAG